MSVVAGMVASVAAAFCWAVSAALYKEGAEGISPMAANLMRVMPTLAAMAVGALLLNLYPLVSAITLIDVVLIVASSLAAFVVGDLLYFVALKKIGVSRATPITSTYPLFVVALQVVFLGEPVSLFIIFAAISAVTGVALLGSRLGSPSSDDGGRGGGRWGVVVAVATAVAWSGSIVMLSAVLETTNLILVAVLRLAVALAALTPLVVISRERRRELVSGKRAWGLLAAGGLVALGAGYVLFAFGILLAGTAPATILSSLTPLFATAIGWRALHEQVGWRTLAGVLCCVTGIMLTAIALS